MEEFAKTFDLGTSPLIRCYILYYDREENKLEKFKAEMLYWCSKVVFFLVNFTTRCTKENRAAGVLDNHAEGEKYKENFLRKYVRNKHPEIMPGINKFFTDPKY
ncbi:hypothetical protein YC2023_101566 [Brassica napus]|nr:unnamed protein product [Brassica napus]